MNKFVFWFLTVVSVLARCSAESIPAINKTSGFAVAHSSQAVERNKEAPHEERDTFAIDSFISSVKAADESLPGAIHAVNMVDVPQMKGRLAIHEVNMMNVPQIKERNEVLATRMETLGIDIDGVVFVTKALESAIKGFSLNDLEWMVLGKVYFEKDESSSGHRILTSKQLFQELNMEITNHEKIKKWTERLTNLNVGAKVVFGKMLWLIEHHNQLNLHLADAAKMAFGSEYLKIKKLPSSDKILEALGEHYVDRDLVESIVRQDKDSKAPLLGPFAIQSFTSSVKTVDESLPRTEHVAIMMDVSEIKERNQVLATRMETLGIDIGGVVFVTKALESVFERYFSLNDLEWMVLGKVYFEKDEKSSGHKVLTPKQLFQELNMENINYEDIKKWALRLKNLKVSAKVVFGKMLWLIEHHNQLNLHRADAAKMAFGSEYLKIKKLPSSDKILEAVGKHYVDRDLVESIVQQDKDSRKRKAPLVLGPFAIESFTSSVKTADESIPRTEHAATMMDVSEIKDRNQVLATQMEKLGIDISGVVFLTEALESVFERYFSRNNLGWMILGKVFFRKTGSSTGFRRLFSKEFFFKELNMEIIDYEEIKKWTARFHSFNVAVEKVFGKMLWLLQHQNELNLDLADAAKMAFGSEYLEKIKLQISDEIRQAVAEHIVDNDLVASIFGQDKPTDRGPFAIESLTSSVKTAGEPLPRTEHAATMMDVSEIKERNQVLATQMEKLGIDIGGVVFVTGALESQFESFFSRNNLGWMVLGRVYFKIAGSSTGYSRLPPEKLFQELNMEIINYEEIKKWIQRLNKFDVAADIVFGKMFWLLHQQNELKLDLADAAKMAFGSEYFETRELPFSDDLLQAVTEHNVDKDVTESLIPQDKDSTMTDIAVDKLLEKIRNYFGEEVHEQPNKKRKLA